MLFRSALYNGGRVIGGLGVSGDTSCADHDIGWRVRKLLGLDRLFGVGGVSGDATRPDNILFDIVPNPNGGTGNSPSGFGHPVCDGGSIAAAAALPGVQP